MTDLPTSDPAADDLFLLVTVGSDHHPFDRLISWVDRWLGDQSDRDVHVNSVVQFGTARPPSHGTPQAFLPHDQLLAYMRSATVVVMQGGPMGILEARAHGRIPVVIPRVRALHEVVDDHQRAFCQALRSTGDLHLAENEGDFRLLLDLALSRPEMFRAAPRDSTREVSRSVAAVAGIADGLVATNRRGHDKSPFGAPADVIDLRDRASRKARESLRTSRV